MKHSYAKYFVDPYQYFLQRKITAQKIKFSIKDFLMENFVFYAVN